MLGGCYEKIHANKIKHLNKADIKKPHNLVTIDFFALLNLK